MGTMAQEVCVVLSAAEREQLTAITADRNRPRKHVERARIVLASADRHPAQPIAQSVGVSRPTVWRWQQRFAESGVEGLLRDKTRKPGKATPSAPESPSNRWYAVCLVGVKLRPVLPAQPWSAVEWTADTQLARPSVLLGL